MINVFQPALGAEELSAVRQVFDSNWVGKGARTDQFESKFAEHIGVERALVQSMTSCTEGLFRIFSKNRGKQYPNPTGFGNLLGFSPNY